MFRRLRIQNFKCWADTGEMRLAPITVLFGRNSSGKTSIIRFVLMLKQTVESADQSRALDLGDPQSLADLGTFEDVVHGHDPRSSIAFELAWDQAETVRVPESERASADIAFRAVVSHDPHSGELVVTHKEYELGNAADGGVRVWIDAGEVLKSSPISMLRRRGRPRVTLRPTRFHAFPWEELAVHRRGGFIAELALSVEQQLRQVSYVGPLRDDPHRSYLWGGATPPEVGRKGENVVAALLAASQRKVQIPGAGRRAPFAQLVSDWLTKLGLLQSLEVKALTPDRRHHRVMVRGRDGGAEVNLVDVGFGVSQVLPVVVQCFYATPRSLVILEQPEIHLHPSAQSGLADLMIEAIHAREGGEDRQIQLLVETHSEHLLERLQRRIAEGRLDKDDVAVYFCEQRGTAATIRRLEVDLFGNIRNWPDGFFGDEMEDVLARAEAEARRRQGALK